MVSNYMIIDSFFSCNAAQSLRCACRVLRRWMMLGRSTLDVRSSLVQGIFIQSSYKDGMPMIRDLGDDNGDDSADQPLHHLIITSRMRMTIGDDEARNSVLSEESEESEEGILGEEHQKEEESEEVGHLMEEPVMEDSEIQVSVLP